MTWQGNQRESKGYRSLMWEVGTAWDGGDKFGSVQLWRFAIADSLLYDHGEQVEGFEPSPLADGPEEDYYLDMVRESGATAADKARVLMVLSRYREWLRLAGEDY